MQKLAVLLISLAVIGLTSADVPPNCTYKFPTLLMLDRCCFQLKGVNSYDIAFENCRTKYENEPHPEDCAARCALNETAIGNPDGGMNYTSFYQWLKDNIKDQVLTNHMIKTLHDCETQVEEMLTEPRYNNAASSPCGKRTYLLHQCAASHGIINCPVSKWKKHDDYCEQILEDAMSCQF